MRQFKFKEWVFKNLLPFYYQEKDTYQDALGKGILQRFMEVCSGYFDTEILEDQGTQPGLDNILNLIDPEITPELFLNYLWEFLGEIPYAYGLIIQGKAYNKDDLRGWLFENKDFPGADPRNLLRYAISLYKIRGTDQFYKILSTFYGVRLELVETTDGGNPGDDNLIPNHDHLVLATYPSDNNEVVATYPLGSTDVRAPYPDGDCYSCFYFLIKLGIGKDLYDQLVHEGRLEIVKTVIQGIVEKYLPIHCKIAKYNNGDSKIVVGVLGDFNDDFNNDFVNIGYDFFYEDNE